MEPENTLDGIKDINNLLCDKIKDIAVIQNKKEAKQNEI